MTKRDTRKPVRQGDVLLMPVTSVPAGAKIKPRDGGQVVIAYGEVTGHKHQIANPDSVGAEILTTAESATFVKLTKKAQLVHEEHATIEIEAGAWQYIPQRQMSDEDEPILVLD